MKKITEAKTRFETVLLQLREMILSGELPPGSRVQEVALGERMGVSRTPVRLSLSVLQQEGLVNGEPNRGFTVREFTIDEVLGAYDVRAVLEGFACRIVAERGLRDAEEKVLNDCLKDGERLLAVGFFDAQALREWSDMNGRFHRVMISATENTALARAWHLVNQHPLAGPSSIVFRTRNLERLFENMRQAQREHCEIVEALKKRQQHRGEALMTEHIYQSREILHGEVRQRAPELPGILRKLITS